MNTLHAGIIGAVAGTCVAFGGAIKDSPYEGFNFSTFIRSPVIGFIAGIVIYKYLHVSNPYVLFLAVIGLERIIVECYKLIRAILHDYKPGKFKFGEWGIPKSRKHNVNNTFI